MREREQLEKVRIFEVGPRDGLQNEEKVLKTEEKLHFISLLALSGLRHIEVTSFVNPKKIPQLSDAIDVAQQLPYRNQVQYSALVPNLKGLQGAISSGMKEIAIFISASETHNRKNINQSIADSFPILQSVTELAISQGLKVRGYVSTVFCCPYEGDVLVDSVIKVTEKLFEMGVYEVSLGDTVGMATPKQVKETLAILFRYFPSHKLAGHFHDTRGTGLANVYAALECGLRNFDSSIGGLGGCPFAPGASGNIATEELVYMLEGMGMRTGIEMKKLIEAAAYIQNKLGRPLPSKVLSAALATKQMGGDSI